MLNHNKQKIKNSLTVKPKNYFCKKVFGMLLFILIGSTVNIRAQALDELFNWASGYKFRTSPAPDGSMDAENYFKNELLNPAEVNLTDHNYVNMKADFKSTQENWDSTKNMCGRQEERAELNPDDCKKEGQQLSSQEVWIYTCPGDVKYNLTQATPIKEITGGDTTYGAWSMLFNYLAPTYEDSCGADGRCFVGNAVITDTRAQKEDHVGLYPGLGQKVLKEAPGEVFYFDQVRSLTQPPVWNEYEPYNDIVLVGNSVAGGTPVGCELPDMTAYDPSGICGMCGSDLPVGELARQILTAAGQTFNVPAAAIWSAMMHEGANWVDFQGQFTDDNVLKWSLPVGCAGYEPMTGCDNSIDGATAPFGILKYWFYDCLNCEQVWGAVQALDPQRDSPDKVSRCNFMDAAFGVAHMLKDGYSLWAGTHCDPCEGYAFDSTAPTTCSWSDAKVIQANVGFIGQCPNGNPHACEWSITEPTPDPISYHTGYIMNNFTPYKCY